MAIKKINMYFILNLIFKYIYSVVHFIKVIWTTEFVNFYNGGPIVTLVIGYTGAPPEITTVTIPYEYPVFIALTV